MAHEFNAKNGLSIANTHAVTSITNKESGITYDSNTLMTENAIKHALDSTVSGITHSTFSNNNLNMVGEVTSSDGDLGTNTVVLDVPTSRIRVFINGTEQDIGPGLDGYFADPSTPTSARTHGEEQQNDKFYWNGSVAEFELDSEDIVDFVYLIDGTSFSDSGRMSGSVYTMPGDNIDWNRAEDIFVNTSSGAVTITDSNRTLNNGFQLFLDNATSVSFPVDWEELDGSIAFEANVIIGVWNVRGTVKYKIVK